MIGNRHKRAGALLAVGFSLWGAALAFAEPTDPATLGAATAPRTMPELDKARLAPLDARGRIVPPASFPVQGGGVRYGEGQAAFGADRGGRMHEGQDLFAPAGTPLVAVRDGVVLETGDDGGRGNYVAIFSPAERETYLYLHMLEPAAVDPGARVRTGQRVGRVGCTGSCFGDHLHFELREGRGAERPPRDPGALLRQLQRR